MPTTARKLYLYYVYVCLCPAQQTIHNIHYAPFTTRYSPPAFPDFLTHTPQQHFFIYIHTNHPCKTSQPTQPNHNITTIPQCKPNTKSQQTNKYLFHFIPPSEFFYKRFAHTRDGQAKYPRQARKRERKPRGDKGWYSTSDPCPKPQSRW